MEYGLYLHELGHVMGLDHEHIRADRDTYLHVNDAGVPEDFKSFFTKKSKEDLHTYDSPYDLQSVMHYGRSSFSVYADKVPIVVKDEKMKHILTDVCKDHHENCAEWAGMGHCVRTAGYMKMMCPESCGFCNLAKGDMSRSGACKDHYIYPSDCEAWAKEGKCVSNKMWMHFNCAKSCDVCAESGRYVAVIACFILHMRNFVNGFIIM
ncbi:unnamed protein product [Hydatigera taeniaeformis]|uniref:Metalloendopeptidase n=1 Tax=Hydatigena taeniaeformis TaxID=6205 RepID=A0A0R3WTJ0_HYDTA|nr:unnamed protein product [Hydatigera taeniaeformis]